MGNGGRIRKLAIVQHDSEAKQHTCCALTLSFWLAHDALGLVAKNEILGGKRPRVLCASWQPRATVGRRLLSDLDRRTTKREPIRGPTKLSSGSARCIRSRAPRQAARGHFAILATDVPLARLGAVQASRFSHAVERASAKLCLVHSHKK